MASMSTLLTPIAALFSPEKAPVDLDVLLITKKETKIWNKDLEGSCFWETDL